MNKIEFFLKDDILYMSYGHLQQLGVSYNTIKKWAATKSDFILKVGGYAYIQFDAIPEDTKEDIPNKDFFTSQLIINQYEETVLQYQREMEYVKLQKFMPFYNDLKSNYELPTEKITETARLAAVINWIVTYGGRDNERLYKAFNLVYPDKWSIRTFYKNKSLAQRNGALSVALDTRPFSSCNNAKKITDEQELGIRTIISDGRARSGRAEYRDFVKYCEGLKIKPVALRTFQQRKKYLLQTKITITASRRGKKYATAKMLPYAGLIQALHAYDQLQVDGWNPPVLIKNKDGKFRKWVLVLAMDAYSKKIVGFSYAETENTLSIMAAIKNAIDSTESLPAEMVMDKHSFNQTKEAAYFKDETAKLGMHFTVTSNPQYKNIIERRNRMLDAHFREYPGYVSEGIKSRSRDAGVSQELMDEYIKNPVTELELKALCCKVVAEYNNTVIEKAGKTPNQLFEESETPNRIVLTMAERMRVLTAQSEAKINNNQITKVIGGIKHEFQLPADLYSSWNNQTVTIRYEDLREGLYLYEMGTDKFIADVPPKEKAHAAKINQTEASTKVFNKNKGRQNGVVVKAQKENENLANTVDESYPQAIALLNSLLLPKDIKQEIEGDEYARQYAINNGINLNMLPTKQRKAFTDKSLQPTEKNRKQPFKVKATASLGTFDPAKYSSNDD